MNIKQFFPITLVMLFSFITCSASAMGYVYDPLGRLESATNNTGSTNYYEYDSNNNLISINQITSSSTPLVVNY